MRISGFFLSVSRFLLPPAIIGTLFLYFYPILFDCSFPEARPAEAACVIPGKQKDAAPAEIAPFRLLALGDPQLEGDTSLPDQNAPLFPSLATLGTRVKDGSLNSITSTLGSTARDLFRNDVPKIFQSYRKRLDLWGNDLYLAHIYRSVNWWSQPTHTVVLGDLLGSQWIGDEEFKKRSDRFWNTVFKGAEKVPRTITESSGRVEVLDQDARWRKRMIAVAGNHDIGYAGDIDEDRIERFEATYGSVNWDIRFRLENATTKPVLLRGNRLSPVTPTTPEIRLIILNSMNLDSPAKNEDLQQRSRDFASAQLFHNGEGTTSMSATVLLTHIPFHKEAGVCVDAPFFGWFPADQGGGIKEQNHLSKDTTDYILNGLLNEKNQGKAIVLNGHDHEGCDTYHYPNLPSSHPEEHNDAEALDNPETSTWTARPYPLSLSKAADDNVSGLREITVRSMMGSYGGNVGFLSGWFDYDTNEWKFEYNSCMLGVQHIWWAVHILDLVVVGLAMAGLVALLLDETRGAKQVVGNPNHNKIKSQ